jgi:hypothetical protein
VFQVGAFPGYSICEVSNRELPGKLLSLNVSGGALSMARPPPDAVIALLRSTTRCKQFSNRNRK